MNKKIELFLFDVRSAHNVGSLFRSADCFGVEKIYLSHTTPGPLDRFGRARTDIAKVALGAESTIPFEHIEAEELVNQKKKEGFAIVCLEQHTDAVAIQKYTPSKDLLLVVGNEVSGISDPLLTLADSIIYIPQYGSKESLNVSVAGGIALHTLRSST